MTLLEDLKGWYETESYPPDGGDINATEVDSEYLDSRRWGTTFTKTYQRGAEFVQVCDVEPATEMQGWGDYGDPEIYEVVPEEVVKIKYVKTTTVTGKSKN